MNEALMRRLKRRERIKTLLLLAGICTIWITIVIGVHSATNVSGIANTAVTGDFNVGGDVYYKGAIGGLPSGSILMYTTSCPTGWTRLSGYDNYYIRIATSAGSTGGSSTHTHTYSHTHNAGSIYLASGGGTHSHTSSGSLDLAGNHVHTTSSTNLCESGGTLGFWAPGDNSNWPGDHSHTVSATTSSTNEAHTHSISGSLSSASPAISTESNAPTYVAVYLCKKN